MKSYFGWIPSEEGEVRWAKKYCCRFADPKASGSPLKHCSSCPEEKVLYGSCSPRTVTVKCPLERASWPGLLLPCVFCALKNVLIWQIIALSCPVPSAAPGPRALSVLALFQA